MKKLITFGSCDLATLTQVLFWIGSIPLVIFSFLLGNHACHTNTYMKVVERSGDFSRSIEINNLPLGVVLGILAFVSGVIIWKIICEFMYIIIKYYKDHSAGI